MRAMQSAADQTEARSSTRDAIIHPLFLRRPFWGAVRSPVACSHWVDSVSRLRLLEKDRPGFGPRVTHRAENDAYPYLARSQNEALHAHIWGQARAKCFVTIFGAKSTPTGAWSSTHAHARMPASARRAWTMPRAEGCCCWGKNPIYKITAQRTYT